MPWKQIPRNAIIFRPTGAISLSSYKHQPRLQPWQVVTRHDVFCGFCGETLEDQADTLSLMREVGYDSAFMFKYSERPGTFAAKHYEDDVPEEEKIRRLNEIIALQNELSLASNRRDIGKTFEVLVEGYSKRSREQMCGRSQQNKMIVFPKGNAKPGDFVMVRITEASSATLIGELV